MCSPHRDNQSSAMGASVGSREKQDAITLGEAKTCFASPKLPHSDNQSAHVTLNNNPKIMVQTHCSKVAQF